MGPKFGLSKLVVIKKRVKSTSSNNCGSWLYGNIEADDGFSDTVSNTWGKWWGAFKDSEGCGNVLWELIGVPDMVCERNRGRLVWKLSNIIMSLFGTEINGDVDTRGADDFCNDSENESIVILGRAAVVV